MKYKIALNVLILCLLMAHAKEILNLGHTNEITVLNSSGDYLSSQDSWHYWSIWDISKKTKMLTGRTDTGRVLPYVSLKNSVFIVPKLKGFDIYHLPNLSPQYVPADSIDNLKLSSNGQYIWSGSNKNLRVWNTEGQSVLTVSGDFTHSQLSSDSATLYVAVVGADSMITFSLSNLADRSVLHFDGAFQAWMVEAERFLTQQGGIVRTYSTAGTREAMQDIGTTTGLAGYGSYFWTFPAGIPDYNLRIYKVGTSALPVKTIPLSVNTKISGSNGYIGILPSGNDTFTICNLNQDSIPVTAYKGSGAYLSCFEGNPQGIWFTGSQSGVINYASFGLSPQYLNLGRIRALSSTPEGKLAAATSTGQVLIFQINNETPTLIDSFAHNSSSLMFSSDGTRLASASNSTDAQYYPDRSLFIFNLNNHSIIRQWNYSINPGSSYSFIQDFDLSKNGLVVSQWIGTFVSNITYTAAIFDISSADSIYFQQSNYKMAPQLNSTGRLSAHWADSTVKLYKGNVLINAFSGEFGGWYNDTQFIINRFKNTTDRGSPIRTWVETDLIDTAGRSDSNFKFINYIYYSSVISDSEIIGPDYWPGDGTTRMKTVYNIRSGKKVFTTYDQSIFNANNPLITPFKSDYLIFQSDTSLNLYNWRQNQLPLRSVEKISHHRPCAVTLSKKKIIMTISLVQRSPLSLSLFSLNGALISSLKMGTFNSGSHTIALPQERILKKSNSSQIPLVAVVRGGSSTLTSKLLIIQQ